MALILSIETSGSVASVALAKNGESLAFRESKTQKEHASFIQPAIQEVLNDSDIALKHVDAVSVSVGPGSYTGLRVGLASAKGICYALKKPLITIGTLRIIAHAAQIKIKNFSSLDDYFIVPMIDARRNEVFTAIFDPFLKETTPPKALILSEHAFSDSLIKPVFFVGDGAQKWQQQCKHPNAHYHFFQITAADMAELSEFYYQKASFSSLNDVTPLYAKEFYSTQIKSG